MMSFPNRFSLLSVLAAFLIVATVAAAPTTPTWPPNQPTVAPTSNAGALRVNWAPATGAQLYTVGWVNVDELLEMDAAERSFLN